MSRKRKVHKGNGEEFLSGKRYELVWVDQKPLRERVLKQYRSASEKLQTLEEGIRCFHEEDVPEFKRWTSERFGSLLTSIREKFQKLHEVQMTVEMVEEIATDEGIPHYRAFEIFLKEKAQAEARFESQQRAYEEGSKGGEHGPRGESQNSTQEEEVDDFEAFAKFAEDFVKNFEELVLGKSSPISRKEEVRFEKKLKESYRNVVRLLHPDTGRKMSSFEESLWHEAQEAYQMKDLETLEAILIRCKEKRGEQAHEERISIILQSLKKVQVAIRKMEAEVFHLKRDLAWGFSKKSTDERGKHEAQAKRSFQKDLNGVERELLSYETRVQQWSDRLAEVHAMKQRRAEMKEKQIKAKAEAKRHQPHDVSEEANQLLMPF